jgi:hypothetical protein
VLICRVSCLICQKNDLVPVTGGRIQESDTPLDWRSCTACSLVGEAGRGEGTPRRGVQKGKLTALNTRRDGTAEMKGNKRLCDLLNARCSL